MSPSSKLSFIIYIIINYSIKREGESEDKSKALLQLLSA